MPVFVTLLHRTWIVNLTLNSFFLSDSINRWTSLFYGQSIAEGCLDEMAEAPPVLIRPLNQFLRLTIIPILVNIANQLYKIYNVWIFYLNAITCQFDNVGKLRNVKLTSKLSVLNLTSDITNY